MSPSPTTTHRVAIEGTDLAFDVDESDTLLSALLRNGVGFPYECNAGGCGSCKYTLLEGEVKEDLDDSAGLKNSDRRKHKHLACISHLKSDSVIQARFDDTYIPKLALVVRQASLISRRPVTHDLWEFEFQTNDPAVFIPGQYAKMWIPGVDGPRSFSMSNIPNQDGKWQFLIKRTEGGAASEILFDDVLEELTVTIDAPYSIAHLAEQQNSQVVCIAGGSGLAPMVSILHGIYANDRSRSKPILVYGGRTERDVIPADYFSSIPEFDPQTQYFPIVSEPVEGSSWSGATGFVHENLDNVLPQDTDQEYFIAGPPPMVEAVRRHLVLERGISVTRLHYDRFF